MVYYRDLREYLTILEKEDMLVRINRDILKETEAFPLVRLQFGGRPEEKRKGFLFENIVSVTGQRYEDWTVCLGVYAPSRQIYAKGMGCQTDEINDTWTRAQSNPIEPTIVSSGPVQEEVDYLDGDGPGLDAIPVTQESQGLSGIVRTTMPWVTKDAETGIRNVGCYGGKLTSKDTLHFGIGVIQHGYIHWKKSQAAGKPMEAAIVIGPLPNIVYASTARLPYGADEYAIAGGISGEPVELVKCKTIDMEVPATAEVVIEGEVSTEYLEPQAAFPEYTGYMVSAKGQHEPVMKVKCITHRKNPIYTTLVEGMPPTESSKIRQIALEGIYVKHLKKDCNMQAVQDVVWYEEGGSEMLCVIKLKKKHPTEAWQALTAAAGYDFRHGKIFIVVDEDIDPRDLKSVAWALSFRMQPHRDTQIIRGRSPGLDPSGFKPGLSKEERSYPGELGTSAILMDATRKWAYPPISLPKKEYMDHAVELWKELGLPALELHHPWFGYLLEDWNEEHEENAKLITEGKYHEVGEKLKKRRIPA